jgi:hypothetical protein
VDNRELLCKISSVGSEFSDLIGKLIDEQEVEDCCDACRGFVLKLSIDFHEILDSYNDFFCLEWQGEKIQIEQRSMEGWNEEVGNNQEKIN